MSNIYKTYFRNIVILSTGLTNIYAGTAIDIDHRFQDELNGNKFIPKIVDFNHNHDQLKSNLKFVEDEKNIDIALPSHSRFVTEISDNKFEVASDIQNIIPTLIDMNQLTYAMGRDEETKILSISSELGDKGWELRPFKGYSGKDNRVEDIPGFVAYNSQDNQFAIVIRGSHTRINETNSADWEVNFDNEMINTSYGKMHRGFYNRSVALIENITAQLKAIYTTLTPQERANARIIVSGHSQGAALATLIAAYLVDELKGPRFLNKDFDNSQSNIVAAYLISAPRIGDDQARQWIHGQIGKHNIVRQNVVGAVLSDPVPYALPGKGLTNFIKTIPFFGQEWADKLSGGVGGASVGYLAADLSKDVLTRNKTTQNQALVDRIKNRFNINNNELSNLIQNNPMKFFKIFTPAQTKITFNRIVFNNLEDIVTTFFAPLHYGSTENEFKEGAYFQPKAIAGYNNTSPQLAQLLNQGAISKQNELNIKMKLFFGL